MMRLPPETELFINILLGTLVLVLVGAGSLAGLLLCWGWS